MNKLLPILLAVVLSGCGGNAKTTLEKCADSTAEKKGGISWKLTQREQDAIDLSEDEYISKYFVKRMVERSKTQREDKYDFDFDSYIDDSFRYKTIKEFALIKSKATLKDKLSNDDYEYYFRQCEDNQSRHPKTFDARWK